MDTLLLVGYFGSGNLGDEMILDAAAERLREDFPDVRLFAPARPEGEWLHSEIEPFPAGSIAQLTALSAGGDAAVWPGGSVLQNKTSSRSLFYYWMVATLLSSFGTPQFMLGQGYGPVRGMVPLFWAKQTLRAQEWISARDQESFKQMAMLLGPSEKMHLGGDTWLLSDAEKLTPPPEEGAVLAVFPRGDPEAWTEGVVAALAEFADRHELSTRLLVSHPEQDRDAAERLEEELEGRGVRAEILRPDHESPEQALRGVRLAVTQRFHGLLLATRQGIPTVPVGGDPKLISAALAMELPRADDPGDGLVAALSELQGDFAEAASRCVSWTSLAEQRAVESWDQLAGKLNQLGHR